MTNNGRPTEFPITFLIQSKCSIYILLQVGVSLIWLRYEIPQNNSRVIKLSSLCENVVRVCLPAPARVARRSQCDAKLLVACIDASIHIVHHTVGLTHSTRAGFVSNYFYF